MLLIIILIMTLHITYCMPVAVDCEYGNYVCL